MIGIGRLLVALRERATGIRDRTQREKLINSFANNITKRYIYPYDIDYNCTASFICYRMITDSPVILRYYAIYFLRLFP